MKKQLLCLLLPICACYNSHAQYFSKITEGDLVNTLSDSRSCNWIDINHDGWVDIQITNGKYPGENNMMYLNNQDGTFITISDGEIVNDLLPSDGATWADIDNDGDLDCVVVNWYGVDNIFYINNGDGTLSKLTDIFPATDHGYSETASWGDFNNDGFVDLYVTNSGGTKKNYLYKNAGDGTLIKITEGDVVNDNDSTRSVNWIDYDNDGDQDIFVTNEAGAHERLYKNNGDETFTSITDNALVTDGGNTISSSWGDIDNDGDEDVFLANDGGNNALFRNDGGDVFTKMDADIVSNDGGNSFGSNFADIDNDGDLDLYVTNAFYGGMWNNYLYINDGAGNFEKITTDISTTDLGWSYGNAFADYDEDGDMDLLVAKCYNGAENNVLYKNETAGNNYIEIECKGVISNRSAIGAVVKIKANIFGEDVWQRRVVSAQSGYCGQNMLNTHFGLGDANQVDSLVIEWPSGIVDIFAPVLPDIFFLVVEGQTNVGILQNDTGNFNLQISPNPAIGILDISYTLESNTPIILQLYDTAGKQITAIQITNNAIGNNHFKINPSDYNLASGTYLLVIKSNNNYSSQKLIFTK